MGNLTYGTDYVYYQNRMRFTASGLTKISDEISAVLGSKLIYIQNSMPVVSPGVPYLWVDTSDGDLSFWVEDGS